MKRVVRPRLAPVWSLGAFLMLSGPVAGQVEVVGSGGYVSTGSTTLHLPPDTPGSRIARWSSPYEEASCRVGVSFGASSLRVESSATVSSWGFSVWGADAVDSVEFVVNPGTRAVVQARATSPVNTPDGKRSGSAVAKIIDLETGDVVFAVSCPGGSVSAATFLGPGTYLAATSTQVSVTNFEAEELANFGRASIAVSEASKVQPGPSIPPMPFPWSPEGP